jgi:hypothetical protein
MTKSRNKFDAAFKAKIAKELDNYYMLIFFPLPV